MPAAVRCLDGPAPRTENEPLMPGPRFPTITPDALAALRARLGQPVRRPEPYIETATRDAIRHWAHGIGDRNPFWLDAGIAPPTILFAMDRIVSGYVGGLPGVHAMWAGADWRWHRPVRRNDEISTEAWLQDLVELRRSVATNAAPQAIVFQPPNRRKMLNAP